MRLVTCGFEVGPPVDGLHPSLNAADFTPLDTTNPRSGDYALKVSSGSGVPAGTNTTLLNSATMQRLWGLGLQRPSTLYTGPGMGASDFYVNRAGFTVRAYVRWNTGDLPDASKAVEFIRATSMTDSAQYGRTALCIDHLGRLHWKADTRGTLPPTNLHTPSTIVPNGYLISSALALDTWHMVDIAITPEQESVRLNGSLIFTRCRIRNNDLRPAIGFGWNVVYSALAVVTNSGSMGASRDVYFDDIAINDVYDDGTDQIAWAGGGRVQAVRPNSDVSNDYSWVPGGPQCIHSGASNGSMPNLLSQVPHPMDTDPYTTEGPPPFYPALGLIPPHTPAAIDFGAPNTWVAADLSNQGYGVNYENGNVYHYGTGPVCDYNSSGVHDVPPLLATPERNMDGLGGDPSDYMVTSGGSDWRGGAGFLCSDTEFAYPRAGGQDALELTCDEPTTSGTVLLAFAWYFKGNEGAGNRPGTRPSPPSGEVGLTPGLHVWIDGMQSAPTDTTYEVVGTDVHTEVPVFGPSFSGDPPLTLKRTTSIGPAGSPPYSHASFVPVYAAGITVEDMSDGGEPLPDTCTALLLIV